MKTLSISNYDLIILDCDGTLVDSEPISNKVIAEMITELGFPISAEESFRTFRGTSINNILEFIKTKTGRLPEFDFEDEYRGRMDIAFEKELKAIPGAPDFLSKLSLPKCVASNGPQRKMMKSLGLTGMLHHFENGNMFSAYDIKIWKPEPDLFLYAAKQMQVNPEKCLVVEDTIHGVEASLKAKMDVLYYTPQEDHITKHQEGIIPFSSYKELESIL